MSFNLIHIWATMGPLAKAIAGVLVVMAIASLAVVVERLIAFARSARESREFASKAAPLLEERHLEQVAELAAQHKNSVLARLFSATISRFLKAEQDGVSEQSAVDYARNESERSREALGQDLRKGLSVLASVGSVAPFVGLLGTVVGIIGAFQGIASTGSGGLGAVSAGIAEALIETAFGLMVAIPAVLLFNFLTTRITSLETALARSAGELIDELELCHGRKSSNQYRPHRAA